MSYVSFASNRQGETGRVGGLFFGRTVRHGPRWAFAIKKLKLNTKSPPGRGGLKSLAHRCPLPRLASRAEKICVHRGLIFTAEIKRNQTHAQQRRRTWGTCRRRDGVGGLNHWPGGRRKPPWLYSEIFFSVAIFCSFDRLRVGPILQPGRWKGESRQRFETPSDQFARAQRCWSADLFSTALKDRRSHAENCREIRGGGYGR